tara:strand:+ start:224 stop:1687 length:1464 start_codon:yes stop_codon:yes gene_type:complete
MKLLLFIVTAIASSTYTAGADDNHLALVRRYADALIENGTDTYGEEHSGMLLSMMNRDTLRPFDKMPKGPSGVRNADRVTPHGSNVNLDQNLYRVLYLLSEITGDAKYRDAADAALTKFLKATPSPKTKLFAWGEHLCWDLKKDGWASNDNRSTHEPKRPTILFEKLHALNPKAMIGYCDGLWEHQIQDHKTGNFSRHADYTRHAPGKDWDFPKEGGYFIHDWAQAWQKTRESRFLDHIDVLASRFLRKLGKTRHKLIEFDSRRGYASTVSSLSLVLDSHRAAQLVGDAPVRDRLEQLTASIDQGLLALPHEVVSKGFVQCVTVEDDYQLYQPEKNGGYTSTWAMKYGRKPTAMYGILCHARSQQLRDGDVADQYRELALQAARKYLTSEPNMADRPWPLELGMAIFLQLAAHESTGDAKFLERARHFAALAKAAYWSDGNPLPKADPKCDHYENATRADTLALALLKLHVIENKLPVKIGISDIDR